MIGQPIGSCLGENEVFYELFSKTNMQINIVTNCFNLLKYCDTKGFTLHLKKSIDEIYRKIGKNILSIQKLEYLLKFISIHQNVGAHISQFNEAYKDKVQSVRKQTMGQLVNNHFNNKVDESANEPDVSNEPYFSIELQFPSTYYDEKYNTLTDLIAKRNDLVHHFFLNYDLQSAKDYQVAEKFLDELYNRINEEVESLKTIAEYIERTKSAFREFIESDQFVKEMEMSYLKNSDLILYLQDIAQNIAREDGWASLSLAGKLIREVIPDEMAMLKQKYGYKSLKPLLLESGLFDLHQESTQVFYRVKPAIVFNNRKF